MTPFHFRFESELYLSLTFYKYYTIFFIKNQKIIVLSGSKVRNTAISGLGNGGITLYSFFITSWPLAGGFLRSGVLKDFLDFWICSQKPVSDCGIALRVAMALGNENLVFQHIKCRFYCGFPFFIGSLILTYIFSDIRSHVVIGKPFVMLLIWLFPDLTPDDRKSRELILKIQMHGGSRLSHNHISFLCLWLVQDALRAARLARAFSMISLTSSLICSISGNSVKNHILISP